LHEVEWKRKYLHTVDEAIPPNSTRPFSSRLFKPINLKTITTMPHLRETLQESGNAFHPMNCALQVKQPDLRFVMTGYSDDWTSVIDLESI
jgi:hypothetical protein